MEKCIRVYVCACVLGVFLISLCVFSWLFKIKKQEV